MKNKSEYFIRNYAINENKPTVWRVRNNKVHFSFGDDWENSGVPSSSFSDRPSIMVRISRDQARKYRPKLFRGSEA
jgi:hypothetical protein